MLSEVVCTQFAEWVDRMPGVTDSLGGGEDRISYHTDTNPLITLPAPIPKRRRTMLLITRDAAAPSCSASSPWGSSSTEWFKLKVTFTLQGKQVQKKCKKNSNLKIQQPYYCISRERKWKHFRWIFLAGKAVWKRGQETISSINFAQQNILTEQILCTVNENFE